MTRRQINAMETSPRIPPACPPRPIEPVRPKRPPIPRRNSDNTDQGNPFNEPLSDETKNSTRSQPPDKAPRASPTKPTPNSTTSPPSATPCDGSPVRNGTPPKQGRKSVRSAPPPIPIRVDLGEKAPEKATSTIQERSNQEQPFKRGFPQHRMKARPEITIVSARPMDSPEVLPQPPAQTPASPPGPVLDAPTVPQKPSRRGKGREPPPRPKSRPVSELIFGDDVPESGPTEGGGKIDKVDMSEADGQSRQILEGSSLSSGPLGPAPVDPAPVGPAPKRPNRPNGDKSVKGTGHGLALNSERTSELNERAGGAVGEDTKLAKIPAIKPTAGRWDVRKNSDREARSPVGNEKSAGAKQAFLDNVEESKVEGSVTGKKSRPTVIMAIPQRKLESAKERENDHETNGEKELGDEKPKPVADESMGDRIKPPAKKPKPTPTPKPDVRPKPTNKTRAPTEKLTNETESRSKPVGVTAPKASMRPTVIAAKAPKTANTPYTKDDEAVESNNSHPLLEVNSPGRELKQERENAKPTSPSTKSKRIPTVIRAPRPVVEGSGNDTSSPDAVRKAPRRPTRGPSMKKPPPPRPSSAPSDEGTTQDGHPNVGKEPLEVTERTQDKKGNPSRPVNLPALKDGEQPEDEEKAAKSPFSDEDSPAFRRKGPSGKLPSPRPPPVQPAAERSDCVLEAHDGLQRPDESPKAKARPRPPRPLPYHSGEKRVSKNQSDVIVTSNYPPARLSPKEIRDTSTIGDAYQDKEKTEKSPKHKAKPDRPPSIITKEAAVSKETAVTERVQGESLRDEHVLEKKDACEQHVDHEEQQSEATCKEEKTKAKARPKPPRPPSTAFEAKKKPQRPPGPHSKDTKETSSVMQVSSVCETYIEPSAVALYDYSSNSLEDLSFRAGDEIILVKRIDDNWCMGRLGNEEGMFPVKFVEIIEDLPQETEKQIEGESSFSFNVIALHDFHGNQQDGELVFTAGELVGVLHKINEDWLMGESCGKTGSFPCSFVDVTPEQLERLEKFPGTEISPSNNCKDFDTDSSRIGSDERPLYKALFDYHSNVQGDLSFNAGDVINLNSKISDEWMEGERNGLTGIFPSSYVEIIEDFGDEAIVSSREEESGTNYSIALYDFTGTSADELSFDKGDKIQITDTINEEWLKGKMNEREGIFPRAFVEFVDENPMASKASNIADGKLKSTLKDDRLTPKAKALFDFSGETEEELSFKAGDVILLLESVNVDWMKGKLGNNLGRFPTTFVEILVPLP